METTVKLLGTYYGRDKIIRTLTYACAAATRFAPKSGGQKLLTVAGQLASCRVILRLFDDLPMLAYTLKYGLGKSERDPILRILNVFSNCCNQLFFPVEHLAWFCEKKILDYPASPFNIAAVTLWFLSLVSAIIRNLRSLLISRAKRAKLYKLRKQESTQSSTYDEMSGKISLLKHQEFFQLLMILRDAADVCNAINWLPAGFLWSGGKFSPAKWGSFGTVSSLIGLYIMVANS